MKKSLFERFIKKYHLNGLIDSAVWVKSRGKLEVKATASSDKLIACVTLTNFNGIENTEIGVGDSRRLLRVLKGMVCEDVSLNVSRADSGVVIGLTFAAEETEIEYVTACLEELDAPALFQNIPAFNAAIKMDDKFLHWLAKAYSILKDDDTLFAILMSKQTGKLEVVMNYHKTGYRDSISFRATTVMDMDVVKSALYFNAKCLRRVIQANTEFKDPILYIADDGFASVKFSEEDLEAEYRLVAIQVED